MLPYNYCTEWTKCQTCNLEKLLTKKVNLNGTTLQTWVSICRKHKESRRKLNNMKKH